MAQVWIAKIRYRCYQSRMKREVEAPHDSQAKELDNGYVEASQ